MDKQVLKLGSRILENLPNMSSDVMQNWIDNPKVLQDFLCGLSPQEKVLKTYLRFQLSLTIAPTKGDVTIAEATEVFTGYVDPNFQKWGTSQAGADTEATLVDVLEMSKDGIYKQLFGSLGRDVRSLCLSQPQIVEFCRSHREHLRQEGFGTFFLFEVNNELLVANVHVVEGRLRAYIDFFARSNDAKDSGCRHRFVVKQQSVWTSAVKFLDSSTVSQTVLAPWYASRDEGFLYLLYLNL